MNFFTRDPATTTILTTSESNECPSTCTLYEESRRHSEETEELRETTEEATAELREMVAEQRKMIVELQMQMRELGSHPCSCKANQ